MALNDLRILLLANDNSALENLSSELSSHGFGNVSLKYTSENAPDEISSGAYDIVIAEGLIKKGLNGLQILEYARTKSKNNVTFMLYSEAHSRDIMLGAIEFDPDDIIIESGSKEPLIKRVTKVMYRHERSNQIRNLISIKDLSEATRLCNKEIFDNTSLKPWAMKKKLEIMAMSENFKSLEDYSRYILNERSIEFVKVMLIESLIGQNLFHDALEEASQASEEFPMSVKSHILKGDCQIYFGDYQSAKKSYEVASKLSPYSVYAKEKITMALKKLSDHGSSARAIRELIELKKDTHHESQEDYVQLAETVSVASGVRKIDDVFISETLELLTSYKPQKPEDSSKIDVQKKLIDVQLKTRKGQMDKAKRSLNEAISLAKKSIPSDAQTMISLAVACDSVGDEEKAKAIVKNINENKQAKGEDKDFIAAYMKSRERIRKFEIAAKLNGIGKECFASKDFEGAVDSILEAIQCRPDYTIYRLNLVSAALPLIESNHSRDRAIKICKDNIEYLDNVAENQTWHQAFRNLKERFQDVLAA